MTRDHRGGREGSGSLFWRYVAGFLALALTASVALLVRALAPSTPVFSPADLKRPEIERRDGLRLEPAEWRELPGWGEDDLSAAVPALRRSCDVLGVGPGDAPLAESGVGGTRSDWRESCEALATLGPEAGSDAVAEWATSRLRPWKVTNRGVARGLFTGYYEPLLRGSRSRHGSYRFPLYRRPPQLVQVDLGAFREDLAGRRIAGRVSGGELVPFHDRTEIDGGALAARGLELVWVDDAVDAFFLHIQGSGRIELEEGGELRVGYDGQNGHPYFAIGRALIDRGEIPREEMSMQSLRRWLAQHPDSADEILRLNASYVFFRPLLGEGPLGSLGVPVTPGRSLAIDRRFLPLGAPLWLDSKRPAPFAEGEELLRRMVVAQDTGGAIRGPVRGDVFWGHGEEAAEVAGRMRQKGRLWLLLPRDLVPETGRSGG